MVLGHLGTELHEEAVHRILNLRAAVVVATVETLGGSPVDIQTTATFNSRTDEFEISCPGDVFKVDAAAALDHRVKYAIITAKVISSVLRIKMPAGEAEQREDREFGTHAFLCRIRGNDGGLLPGVEVVAGGATAASLRFERFCVPRCALLNRKSQVSRSGEYTTEYVCPCMCCGESELELREVQGMLVH